MASAVFKADNLTAIVDFNEVQATSTTAEIFPIPELSAKWASFGWNVIEIDGHNMVEILTAIDAAAAHKGQPTVIIAKTVKGKCFPFAEGKAKYHNAAMDEKEYEVALACIAKMREEVQG